VVALIAIAFGNEAMVEQRVVAAAERAAEHVFEAAGIRLMWHDSPGAIRFHLVRGRWNGPHADATGFAVLPPKSEPYAGASYAAIEAAAESMGIDPALLLGATIAHEIGHVLLGPAHSRTGIMCPSFRWEQMRQMQRGELRFTPEQAARLRTIVGLRETGYFFSTDADSDFGLATAAGAGFGFQKAGSAVTISSGGLLKSGRTLRISQFDWTTSS
jgi:hypothetical protein